MLLGIFLLSSSAPSEELLTPASSVGIQMRGVNLHLGLSTFLEISNLRGQMVPTGRNRPVTFDDLNSFVIRVSSAEVAVSVKVLSDLLNQRVFAYPGAPFKNVSISVHQGRISEKGTVRKGIDLPFEIEGTLDVNSTGEVRLRADKVEAAHVPAKGLLHLFGGDLSKLINLKQDRGVRVEGDDILLNPSRMLPAPKLEGKITAARIKGDRIILTFGSGAAMDLIPPFKADSYIYHRGGVLRFGKLTMTDSDLELVNDPPHSPFDFSLPEYNRQLVAGYSKNTRTHGLLVFLPDFKTLPPNSQDFGQPN